MSDFDVTELGSTALIRARTLMAQLRNKESGCPWDVAQDYKSIGRYTIEEAYEVVQAIENEDMAELKDELGDLLLQVLFYAQMAQEDGYFDLDDVANGLVEKMVRRHPHVFGNISVADADAQTLAWEEQKASERAQAGDSVSALDGVALGLPALLRAQKLQKRAARVGFDWPDIAPVIDKLKEEADEIAEAKSNSNPAHIAEEVGDFLFAAVNMARHLGVDAEDALRAANKKFTRRFTHVETHAGETLSEMTLDDMETLWQDAKRIEKL
ncbi:nucleoside triphosphate pyrophosphohydrolase [Robiginitomaculum antarcticum]|uniref:nucleoside triphosphate pyrophosphohydrolase n=1 Tax=Robiginitomaculum antarcticum TaxID=437507 RepID=UPI0003808E26|nr:nucleoside triphosphate pyrophosphohydrolase [Robiginitomaculum antarcticum]